MDEEELQKLYRMRVKDRKNYKSRRMKQVDLAPQRLEGLLTLFFQGDKEAVRRLEESRAMAAWVEYVGEAAARMSQPIKIKGTQLLVRVADPLWMQELLMLKNDLLRRYRKDFPRLGLNDIYFMRVKY